MPHYYVIKAMVGNGEAVDCRFIKMIILCCSSCVADSEDEKFASFVELGVYYYFIDNFQRKNK